MFRSLHNNLTHENDYKSMKPTYQTQHELTNIIDSAITDSIGTSAKIQPHNTETMRIDNRYQEIGTDHYEDILATATLNKVLEICESVHQGEREQGVDIGGGSLEHGGTDTDSGLSGSIVGEALKRAGKSCSEGISEGSSSPLCESPKEGFTMPESSKNRSSPSLTAASPDIGVVLDTTTDNSVDFPWSYGTENDSYTPLQFKIEEHIEEITTHHLTDEEASSSSYVNDSDSDSCPPNPKEKMKTSLLISQETPYGSSTFRKKQYSSMLSSDESTEVLQHFDLPSISGEDIVGANRVPFPELGVDLLQESATTTTDGGPIEVLLENSNWKENWLFKKEKTKVIRDNHTTETITMLIPNPSSNINPTIGDRDIDELSELSDRHSNYSFDTTSSDEEYASQNYSSTKIPTVASKDLVDLVGEISAEFGQQDQEYTEDVSKLEKLHFNTNYRNIDNSTCSDVIINKTTNGYDKNLNEESAEEITGVTPVIKPRKFKSLEKSRSSFNSDTYTRSSKIVKKIQKSKAGKPSCIVLNPPEGVPQEVGETLQTTSPSVWFESSPEDQSVPSGRALRLNCQVHSRDICGVSWYFRNELLKEGKNVLMWKKGDTYHLNVFEMDETKNGPYYVAAYTKDHCVWGRCLISCIDQGRVNKIPRITLTLPEVLVENGDDILLECQVGGHPEPKVSFIRNSTPLCNQYPNCSVENDQYGTWTLHLKEVTEATSGQIKVIASNTLGHAMSFFNIKVIPEGQGANISAGKLSNSKSTSKTKKSTLESTITKTKATKSSVKRTNENHSNNNIINNHNSNIGNAEHKRISSSYNEFASNSDTNAYYNNNEISVNGCMFQPPKPGTIAEREHRKWLEAKPLPNNPYSPEKLASRIGRSPSRFPSLPTVYRENSGDESQDPSLRETLLSSASDLTRYSRDYHINNSAIKNKTYPYNLTEVDENFEQIKKTNFASTTPKCLVKLESRVADNWKEELKNIKLDVGKKVADIQKTIDAYQHEWEKQMRQRSSTASDNRFYSLQRGTTKLSASCFNLNSPVKSKSSVPYSSSSSNSKNRHLVYSSTETLYRDPTKNNLWRTVSVDTLNPPFKYSFPSLPSNHKTTEKGPLGCKETELNSSKESIQKRFSATLQSDSDDSSNINTPLYIKNHSYTGQSHGNSSTFAHQNGYATKRMTSYCSENSIESLKEESDTEESLLSCADDSNMPSVKELAFKFDSLKNTKNKSSETRTHHENLRPSRNRNVTTSPTYNINNNNDNNINNNVSRKYNDRVIVNEVRIGGKPTKIYGKSIHNDYPRLHNKFEGFKDTGNESYNEKSFTLPPMGTKPASSSSSSFDVFTPTEKVTNHFTFEDFHHRYRNRFSTSELNKADEFWGTQSTSNLQRMRTLNVSNSSSIAESDISAATLPAIPDSTSRDIFGIKLRKGDFYHDRNKHESGSSSDIFPLSKVKRPKSVPDFRVFQDISDEETDSMNKHDPVIARTHNLPKFHANITKKEEKSYKTALSVSLHNISDKREPLEYESRNYRSTLNFGAFAQDKKSGPRMYDFIKKYENKKSLNEIHSYVHHHKPELEVKKVTTPIENEEEKQIKQGNEVNFSVLLRPKFKKRGSMQDFLKMYSNKTTLPPISNSEENEIIPKVNIKSSNENLNNSSDYSPKKKQDEDSRNVNVMPESNEKIIYTSKASVQVNTDTRESYTSNIAKQSEEELCSEASNAQTKDISSDKSEHKSPQVSTFVYASVNKPKIKPKPNFLTVSKIDIEEKTNENSTKDKNLPSRLPENFIEIKPDYSMNKYKYKVSKYHIIPKSVKLSEDETGKERNIPSLIEKDEKLSATKNIKVQEIEVNFNDKSEERLQNVNTIVDDKYDDNSYQVSSHTYETSRDRTGHMSPLINYEIEHKSAYVNDIKEDKIQPVSTLINNKPEGRSQHVSTLVYGSMNKPMAKPKPNFWTNNIKANEDEIKIAEISENDINTSRHSKYHITTKNSYHQYLNNYSNIKSLKDIQNQRDYSEHLKLAHPNSFDGNTSETTSILNISIKSYKENDSDDNNSNGKRSKSPDILSDNRTSVNDANNDIVNTKVVQDKEPILSIKDNTNLEKEKQSLNSSNFKYSNDSNLNNDLQVEENINIYEASEVKASSNITLLIEDNKINKLTNEEELSARKDTKSYLSTTLEENLSSNINIEVKSINETLINHEKNGSSIKSENKTKNSNEENQISANISSINCGTNSPSQIGLDLEVSSPKLCITESKVEKVTQNTKFEESLQKSSTTNKPKVNQKSTENISTTKPNNIQVKFGKPKENVPESDAHIKELKQILTPITEDEAISNQTYFLKQKTKPVRQMAVDDDDTDPISLTKRIVRGARTSSSGLSAAQKYNIAMASLPEKSPFAYKQRKFEDLPK